MFVRSFNPEAIEAIAENWCLGRSDLSPEHWVIYTADGFLCDSGEEVEDEAEARLFDCIEDAEAFFDEQARAWAYRAYQDYCERVAEARATDWW